MKFKTRNTLEHTASILVSILLNGALFLALLHFIILDPDPNPPNTTTIVLASPDERELEEIDEILPEVLDQPTLRQDVDDTFKLDDGSWRGSGNANSKTGMTGLALLTFLAHGETPTSAEYGETVQKAIRFLVAVQQDAGDFRHTEGGNRGGVYANGIATYALSEAYAMTRIPMLRDPMERGIAFIVKGQREDGGFDYRYAKGGGERDRCTSVAGWQSQALKAALMAGAEVPGLREAAKKAAEGLKLNQRDDHKFLYASGGGPSGIGDRKIMTSIAVLCLQILGEGQSREARNGMRTIASASPEDYHEEMEPEDNIQFSI